MRYTGSQPNVGSFDCRVTPDGDDWCIFIFKGDERIERWTSTWQNSVSKGLPKVYDILREYGFAIDE